MSIIGQLNLLFAEAAESEPDALAWSPDLALFTLLLFIVFITVLSYFAWKPIMSALDEREKSVSDKIDSAEANADRMERLKVEYEEKLAAAAEDAAQMIAEAKRMPFWSKTRFWQMLVLKRIDNGRGRSLISKVPKTPQYANWPRRPWIRQSYWQAILFVRKSIPMFINS